MSTASPLAAHSASPARSPAASTSRPARPLPRAAPAKIALPLQLNASVAVPSGAAPPSRTLCTVHVRRDGDAGEHEQHAHDERPGGEQRQAGGDRERRHEPGQLPGGGGLRVRDAVRQAARRRAQRPHGEQHAGCAGSPRGALGERRQGHLQRAEAGTDARRDEQQPAHGRRAQRPAAASRGARVRDDGPQRRGGDQPEAAREHEQAGGEHRHRRAGDRGEAGDEQRPGHEAELDDDGLQRVGRGQVRGRHEGGPQRAHHPGQRRHRRAGQHGGADEHARPRAGPGEPDEQQQRRRVQDGAGEQDAARPVPVGPAGALGGGCGEGHGVRGRDHPRGGVRPGGGPHEQQQRQSRGAQRDPADEAGEQRAGGARADEDGGVAGAQARRRHPSCSCT